MCVRGAFSGRVLPDLASHCTTGPSGFFVSYSNLSPSLLPSPGPYTWVSFRAESIAYRRKNNETRHRSRERPVLISLCCDV